MLYLVSRVAVTRRLANRSPIPIIEKKTQVRIDFLMVITAIAWEDPEITQTQNVRPNSINRNLTAKLKNANQKSRLFWGSWLNLFILEVIIDYECVRVKVSFFSIHPSCLPV